MTQVSLGRGQCVERNFQGNKFLGTSREKDGYISYKVPVVLHLGFVQLRKIENNAQFVLGKLMVKWCQFEHPTQMEQIAYC